MFRAAKNRHAMVTRIQLVLQAVRKGITLAGKRIGERALMEKRDMIRLLEGIFEELPVGTQLRLP